MNCFSSIQRLREVFTCHCSGWSFYEPLYKLGGRDYLQCSTANCLELIPLIAQLSAKTFFFFFFATISRLEHIFEINTTIIACTPFVVASTPYSTNPNCTHLHFSSLEIAAMLPVLLSKSDTTRSMVVLRLIEIHNFIGLMYRHPVHSLYRPLNSADRKAAARHKV